MKFGKYIQQNSTPEWKTQFLDYKGLKKIIRKIVDHRKELERLRQLKHAQMLQQQEMLRQQSQSPPAIHESESTGWFRQSVINRTQDNMGDDTEVILEGEPVDRLIRDEDGDGDSNREEAAHNDEMETESNDTATEEILGDDALRDVQGKPPSPIPSIKVQHVRSGSIGSRSGFDLSPPAVSPRLVPVAQSTGAVVPRLRMPPRPKASRIPREIRLKRGVTFGASSMAQPTAVALHAPHLAVESQEQQGFQDLESGGGMRPMPRSISREIIFRVEDIAVPTHYDEDLDVTLRYGLLAKEFLDKLNKELDKINRFYLRMERKFAEKQGALSLQINALRREKFRLKKKKARIRHKKTASADSTSDDVVIDMTGSDSRESLESLQLSSGQTSHRRRRRSQHGRQRSSLDSTSSPIRRRLGRHANTLPKEVTYNLDEASRKLKAKQLKEAYQEHYRSLVLLENYRALNYVGFAKILKKFDKNSENYLRTLYMKKVSDAPFYTSSILKSLMRQTETNTIRYLYDNDRKKAMSDLRLRPKSKGKEAVASFRSGTWLGMSIITTLLLLYIYLFEWIPSGGNDFSQLAMYLFRLTLFPTILALLLSVNAAIWERVGINYVFIFEFDPRRYISKSQFSEVALLLYLSWTVFFFAYMVVSIYETRGVVDFYQLGFLIPAIYTVILVTLVVQPLKLMYRRTRYWLLNTLLRILFAPFAEIKFKDFWLADQLTSLGEFLFQVQFVFCFSTIGMFNPMNSFCDVTTQIGLPIFNAWPFYARFMQCIRRFRDTKKFHPHISNAMKYFTSLVFIVFAFLDKAFFDNNRWNAMRVAWLAVGMISTTYSLLWDYIMDWGLLRFGKGVKYPLLRSELMYPWYWYYLAMVENFLIRFLWLALFILRTFLPEYMNTDAALFIIVFLNLFRRFVWNIFRLEMEHMYNIGEYRAVRDMPLPYEVNPEADEDIERDEGFDYTKFRRRIVRILQYLTRLTTLCARSGKDGDSDGHNESTLGDFDDLSYYEDATEDSRIRRRMSLEIPGTMRSDKIGAMLKNAPAWLELRVADTLIDREPRSRTYSRSSYRGDYGEQDGSSGAGASGLDRTRSTIGRLLRKLSINVDDRSDSGLDTDDDDEHDDHQIDTEDEDEGIHSDDTGSILSYEERGHDEVDIGQFEQDRHRMSAPPSPIATDFERMRTLQENFISNIRREKHKDRDDKYRDQHTVVDNLTTVPEEEFYSRGAIDRSRGSSISSPPSPLEITVDDGRFRGPESGESGMSSNSSGSNEAYSGDDENHHPPRRQTHRPRPGLTRSRSMSLN